MQSSRMVGVMGRDDRFDVHLQNQHHLLPHRRTRAHDPQPQPGSSLVSNPYSHSSHSPYDYSYQQHRSPVPQSPPSPPGEDTIKPSLPSISSLLGMADGEQQSGIREMDEFVQSNCTNTSLSKPGPAPATTKSDSTADASLHARLGISAPNGHSELRASNSVEDGPATNPPSWAGSSHRWQSVAISDPQPVGNAGYPLLSWTVHQQRGPASATPGLDHRSDDEAQFRSFLSIRITIPDIFILQFILSTSDSIHRPILRARAASSSFCSSLHPATSSFQLPTTSQRTINGPLSRRKSVATPPLHLRKQPSGIPTNAGSLHLSDLQQGILATE
jgi:hypothetical protein